MKCAFSMLNIIYTVRHVAYIELADIGKVLIQCFNQVMNELQKRKLVLQIEKAALTMSSSLSTPMIKYKLAYRL